MELKLSKPLIHRKRKDPLTTRLTTNNAATRIDLSESDREDGAERLGLISIGTRWTLNYRNAESTI